MVWLGDWAGTEVAIKRVYSEEMVAPAVRLNVEDGWFWGEGEMELPDLASKGVFLDGCVSPSLSPPLRFITPPCTHLPHRQDGSGLSKATLLRMARREVRVLSSLHHPNILHLLGLLSRDNALFIGMSRPDGLGAFSASSQCLGSSY